MQRAIILQAGPDMPGIQAQNQINSGFDLSDRPRGFLLDAFNVAVILLFDIVQLITEVLMSVRSDLLGFL